MCALPSQLAARAELLGLTGTVHMQGDTKRWLFLTVCAAVGQDDRKDTWVLAQRQQLCSAVHPF